MADLGIFVSRVFRATVHSKYSVCLAFMFLITLSVECRSSQTYLNDDFGDNLSESTNTTNSQSDLAIGLSACAVSVFFFGSNFVPVKKFNTGDGMFFQWTVCSAIWMSGLVVQLIRKSPPFQPLAMLGGCLWASGNICVVPIIKTIGLSLGMLLWGTINLVTGWASGRFGWFGLISEVPSHLGLNYAGVSLAFFGAIVFVFVRSEIKPLNSRRWEQTSSKSSEYQSITYTEQNVEEKNEEKSSSINSNEVHLDVSDESWVDKLTPGQKRFVGVFLSVLSGALYGLNFDPVTYLTDNKPGISKNGLDYVFSHFSGVYVTSSVYFIIYAAFKRNSPVVFPRAILPGFISGIMWAIAQSAWFVANQRLSQAVSFPIISAGPSLIASLWGIFVFGEIRGKRNLCILLIACSFSVTGAVLAALSKID